MAGLSKPISGSRIFDSASRVLRRKRAISRGRMEPFRWDDSQIITFRQSQCGRGFELLLDRNRCDQATFLNLILFAAVALRNEQAVNSFSSRFLGRHFTPLVRVLGSRVQYVISSGWNATAANRVKSGIHQGAKRKQIMRRANDGKAFLDSRLTTSIV